jgi:hypothetical protein
VKDVEAFRDSKLVVQQMLGEAQCLDGELNQYREACLALVQKMDTFHIRYVLREENQAANKLARHASGYVVKRGRFLVKWRPTACHVVGVQTGEHESAVEEHNLVKEAEDWRQVIKRCIEDPSSVRD